MSSDGFVCSRCGERHPGPPLSWHLPAPEPWYHIPEAERAQRAVLGSDNCEIDGQHFFLRGLLEIPLRDGPAPVFTYGVWLSQSEPNYRRALDLWTTPGREQQPPTFGWFSSVLPGYPSTLNIQCLLHTRPVGERPWVELHPESDHPLALEQRSGITMARVREIAELLHHT